jgi:hypothetical protein
MEDENFVFLLSWIDGGSHKGWTFHYYPKHPPFSKKIVSVLDFLDLDKFLDCPFFDFTECYWQFIPFHTSGDSFFNSNAQSTHDVFKDVAVHFSPGIEALINSNSLVVPFGFSFLKRTNNFEKSVSEVEIPQIPIKDFEYDYDVAISFSGSQRPLAERFAEIIRSAGFLPFYDNFYPEQLWGKDLVVFFDDIYRKKSRFCVIFCSQEYIESMWTNHERQSAQSRALEEKGKEYILPIMVDKTELPGMPPTIGYVSLENYSIDQIAELLIRKLKVK